MATCDAYHSRQLMLNGRHSAKTGLRAFHLHIRLNLLGSEDEPVKQILEKAEII